MLEMKEWESEVSRVHFKSGVRLGTATFNLMISMLPAKFVTLLEFAGFSGNRVSLSNGTTYLIGNLNQAFIALLRS